MRRALLLTVVLLAGCGSDDESGGGAAGEVSAQVELTATDFAFDPAEASAASGEVELTLVNDGGAPHALAFDDVAGATDTIAGGETTTLTVELEPGTYTFFCPVGNHRSLGMEGTLVVGGGAAGGGATTGGKDPLYGG